MTNEREDIILTGGGERPVRYYWWAPSSLLTPEARAITAVTLVGFSMFGFGSWTLLVQAVLGAQSGPGPDDVRAENLLSAAILLVMALGAIFLASGVLRGAAAQAASWASQLARAAVAVGALSALLSGVTIIGVLLRHSPAGV